MLTVAALGRRRRRVARVPVHVRRFDSFARVPVEREGSSSGQGFLCLLCTMHSREPLQLVLTRSRR
jgi:hypothetical protein